jgi:hypothetical protein
MCLLTGCNAGPGCPHYTSNCKAHIAHQNAQPAQAGQVLPQALTLEQCITFAKLAGIKLSPTQFSGVLEAEVSEFELQTFANLCIGIVGEKGGQ